MDSDDRPGFAELLNKTAAIYNRQMSEFELEMWWDCTSHRALTDIEQAIRRHVQDPDRGQFMPKPADISRQLDGTGDSRALEAWTKVERAIERHGSWGSLVFDDPAIHAVIADMGGWARLCSVDFKELPFKRQEFTKRWMAYLNHPPASFPPVLIGEGGTNFDQPLAMVGDQSKCQQVMLESKPREQIVRKLIDSGD